MCFSASANFIGSAVLGAIGVVTLTEVKHRRELLFAAMPLLFALHQFTEGFVWLGLDGRLPPIVTHDAAAAYILYAQGLLPFLLPLSVLLIEPTGGRQRRMLDFSLLGAGLTLYLLWGLIAYPLHVSAAGHGIVYINQITTTTCGRNPLRDCDLRGAVLFRFPYPGPLGGSQLDRSPHRDAAKAI